MCCLHKIYLSAGWKDVKIFQATDPSKQAGFTTKIPDFHTKAAGEKNEDSYFLLIKGTINQEEITILNIYAQYECLQLHKINNTVYRISGWPSKIKVGNFNMSFSSINRWSQQNINIGIRELDLRPNGLIDIYRISYPNTVEYSFFFSNPWNFL